MYSGPAYFAKTMRQISNISVRSGDIIWPNGGQSSSRRRRRAYGGRVGRSGEITRRWPLGSGCPPPWNGPELFGFVWDRQAAPAARGAQHRPEPRLKIMTQSFHRVPNFIHHLGGAAGPGRGPPFLFHFFISWPPSTRIRNTPSAVCRVFSYSHALESAEGKPHLLQARGRRSRSELPYRPRATTQRETASGLITDQL